MSADLHQIIASLAQLEKITPQSLREVEILSKARRQLYSDLGRTVNRSRESQSKVRIARNPEELRAIFKDDEPKNKTPR